MADNPTLEMEPATPPAKRKGVKRRMFLIGGVAVVGAGLFGISMADSNAVKNAAKLTTGKGDRQPIQQLGMRGAVAGSAEVVQGGDDAAAEVVLPRAVDQHPGRKRVLPAGQPTGKREPAAARRQVRLRFCQGNGRARGR